MAASSATQKTVSCSESDFSSAQEPTSTSSTESSAVDSPTIVIRLRPPGTNIFCPALRAKIPDIFISAANVSDTTPTSTTTAPRSCEAALYGLRCECPSTDDGNGNGNGDDGSASAVKSRWVLTDFELHVTRYRRRGWNEWAVFSQFACIFNQVFRFFTHVLVR